ncbi:MAG TPA: NADH:ubiquinone oxidoreductase [Thermoplasmata archaeon]|nr:NADH:ubiquinone oxidoreductase [Thermoplasmata archaeon]
MSSWIERSVTRGILTSRYPRETATDEELPVTARAPRPVPGAPPSAAAVSSCPVAAISEKEVDQGKCIRCARCLPNGLSFTGPAEAATRSRAELREGAATPPGTVGLGAPLRELGRSLHVFLIDVGSCNACNLEVLALANPFYDSQRLGIFFTNSPRHADVLLVVGVPTAEMVEPLRRAYEALPAPKAVVAVGACPISGGAFAGTPGLAPVLAELLPVDVFVPGCPPTPVNLLDGLLMLSGRDRRSRGA